MVFSSWSLLYSHFISFSILPLLFPISVFFITLRTGPTIYLSGNYSICHLFSGRLGYLIPTLPKLFFKTYRLAHHFRHFVYRYITEMREFIRPLEKKFGISDKDLISDTESAVGSLLKKLKKRVLLCVLFGGLDIFLWIMFLIKKKKKIYNFIFSFLFCSFY